MGPAKDKHQTPTHRLKLNARDITESETIKEKTIAVNRDFLLTVPRRCFFVESFGYSRFVSAMLSCLFSAALWSPAGKRANLLAIMYVMFSCVLSLSHVVSWVRCGIDS